MIYCDAPNCRHKRRGNVQNGGRAFCLKDDVTLGFDRKIQVKDTNIEILAKCNQLVCYDYEEI